MPHGGDGGLLKWRIDSDELRDTQGGRNPGHARLSAYGHDSPEPGSTSGDAPKVPLLNPHCVEKIVGGFVRRLGRSSE